MSEFNANKINPDNINEGKKFKKGDGINPNDLNQVVEGILFAEGSGSSSGLTEEEKAKVDKLVIDGTGDKFLADDGEYKEVSGGSSLDVQINGTSIVENGVANIPLATQLKVGLIRVYEPYGTLVNANGILSCDSKTLAQYNSGSTAMFIGKGTLENIKNDFVKQGIVANTIDLTAEEKANAQKWLGATKLYKHYIHLSDGGVRSWDSKIYLLSSRSTLIANYNDLVSTLNSADYATVLMSCSKDYAGANNSYGKAITSIYVVKEGTDGTETIFIIKEGDTKKEIERNTNNFTSSITEL